MKFLNELTKIMNQHQMVAVYSSEDDIFYTGYIQAVDDTGLLLSIQNYGGYNNGFVFFTDIVNFETDSLDTKRHEKIFQIRKTKPERFEVPENDNLFETILKICFEKNLFCNIFKSENDIRNVTGFISELDKKSICINCINQYGIYFGKCYIAKADIYQMFIEGETEQVRRLLYENA